MKEREGMAGRRQRWLGHAETARQHCEQLAQEQQLSSAAIDGLCCNMASFLVPHCALCFLRPLKHTHTHPIRCAPCLQWL